VHRADGVGLGVVARIAGIEAAGLAGDEILEDQIVLAVGEDDVLTFGVGIDGFRGFGVVGAGVDGVGVALGVPGIGG
jgi:hypothetical protein